MCDAFLEEIKEDLLWFFFDSAAGDGFRFLGVEVNRTTPVPTDEQLGMNSSGMVVAIGERNKCEERFMSGKVGK